MLSIYALPNRWTEPVLVGKGNPKVAISTDGTIITDRNADEKEYSPSVIAIFFGVQQAVVVMCGLK